MNRVLQILCLIALGVVIFTAYKGCNQKSEYIKPTIITKERHIIDSLKTITIHDTVNIIRTRYRNRIDTALKNIHDTTAWVDVCRIAGIKATESECKRILVAGYLSGIRDSQLLGVYQRQRNRDSTIISHLEALNTMNESNLMVCMTEQAKTVKAAKKNTRRKRMWMGVAGVLGLVMVLK